MNPIDLPYAAAQGTLSRADLEATGAAIGMSLHEISDRLARSVAEGHLRGTYSWELGDAAMNHLSSLAYVYSNFGLPEFAWSIFGAFDEGEYIHQGEPPELDGEARTKALLLSLLQPMA
jgi:hypothetical protein